MTDHPGPSGPLHHVIEGTPHPPGPSAARPPAPGTLHPPAMGTPHPPVPGATHPPGPVPSPPVGERSPGQEEEQPVVHSPSGPGPERDLLPDPIPFGPRRDRVILVHGFTQTVASWRPVAERLVGRFEVVRVDLPGHGGSGGVRVGFEEAAGLVGETGGVGAYVGYSLGVRLCLRLALDRPDLVPALVLIGASPGIGDPGGRAGRRAADEALARRVERDGVAAFLDHWLAGPLFATLPARAAGREERLANTAEGLAYALRRLGTGAQEPLWDRLDELRRPVLLVAGERDPKFAGIARDMAAAIGPAARVEMVPGAGHAVHLERPAETAALVEEFLAHTLSREAEP
jgi:2-succinyl-6-hydroxy-2,4-cyclohexadiene-1-carboxylate synthase